MVREVHVDAQHADTERHSTTGSPQPGGWPLMQKDVDRAFVELIAFGTPKNKLNTLSAGPHNTGQLL